MQCKRSCLRLGNYIFFVFKSDPFQTDQYNISGPHVPRDSVAEVVGGNLFLSGSAQLSGPPQGGSSGYGVYGNQTGQPRHTDGQL